MVKKESQIVVSNTGPIISLILIDNLTILKKLYGKVLITNEVLKEVRNKQQKEILEKELCQKWLTNIKPPRLNVIHDLDKGEETSISLALQYTDSLFLTDDFQARGFATFIGLKVMGTLGILLLAKYKKLIPSLKNLIHELTLKERWYSKELIAQVLKEANE